jgi:hypothetical protein
MANPNSKTNVLVCAGAWVSWVILWGFFQAASEPVPMPAITRWLLLAPLLALILLGAMALVLWPKPTVSPIPINHFGSQLDPDPRSRLFCKAALSVSIVALGANVPKKVAAAAVETSMSAEAVVQAGRVFQLIHSHSDVIDFGSIFGAVLFLTMLLLGHWRREQVRNDPSFNVDDPYRDNWLR